LPQVHGFKTCFHIWSKSLHTFNSRVFPSLPYSLGVKHKHSICKCLKCWNALLNGRQPKNSCNIFLL
jgi:hypothetical protein